MLVAGTILGTGAWFMLVAGALHWQGTATCQEQDLAQVGSRHCYLARTKTSWWQAKYLAGTGAWFMLVAGTATWQEQDLVHVGGRHSTWQEQGLGSCWWQPLLLGKNMIWLMLVAGTILCW